MRTMLAGVALAALVAAACGGGGGGPGGNPFGQPTPRGTGPPPAATTPAGANQQPGSPAATAASPSPTPNPGTYTVQAGDTLGAIAERFGVTIADLVAANALADPDLIFPGQELRIPKPGATPTPTP